MALWGTPGCSVSPSCCSSLLVQGLKGFPGLPGPQGTPGLPVSGAGDVPSAKIWVLCSLKCGSEVPPCHTMGMVGCWRCWRSCEPAGGLVGRSQRDQRCHCHPGSGWLPWSPRTHSDAVWGGAAGECVGEVGVRGFQPHFCGCHPGGKGLTAMLSHVPLLLRSSLHKVLAGRASRYG